MNPSFTAAFAHRRALRTAQRSVGTSEKVHCHRCSGTGTLKMQITTIGMDGTSQSTSEIPCLCEGRTVDPVQQSYSQLIWCKCHKSKESSFVYARDGHRIFGNTTYLCGACGFVKQFG